MSSLSTITSVFLIILCPGTAFSMMFLEDADTATINNQTKNAYISARRNPDMSVLLGHKALSASGIIMYKQGMADASLALGMAYLAKYNIGDSAYFYNIQSFNLYQELDDIHGQARACYALAYVYSFKGNLKESERYSTLSLNFFEQAEDKRGMLNAYSALTYLARQHKDFEKARELVQQAIEIASSINDTLPLADAINSLGNIYKDMALFNEAIDSYFEALRLWEMKKDSSGLSIAYGSIGNMYYYQKDYDNALKFNFKKLPISEAAGDLWEVSKTLNNISQIYSSKTEYDSALFFIRKSLNLNKEMNYPSGVANVCYNMATTMLLKSETDSAFFYINKAIKLARGIDDPALVNYLITLGHIYKVKGDYPMALQNALMAYSLAKDQNLPIIIAQASTLLSDIYSLMGRNDLAYSYLKEYHQLNDSISNDEFHNRITRMDIQYEYDQKQKATEFAQMQERILHENRIKQQGIYLKGLLILILFLVIISILYIRHSRFRAQYARIDLEQRLLRAQMNPHFIFNSLCAVQDFILAGKPNKANAFLTKIAKLMRNILENSREEYIALDKEIETLKLYLDVQQLRFETEFEYNFIIDESIDPENLSVPPMLAQPCVENSIEHGLLPRKIKGHLSISYSLKNELLMLEVTDDGVGREQAANVHVSNIKKQSISTRLTEKRLEHFRKALKEKNISYEIIDLYEGSEAAGTKVVMVMPYKKIFA